MDGHTPDERLIDFLYGELSEPELERFERHLQECPECRAELAALQGVLRLVRAEPREEPPERISARILQQARAERVRPGAAWFWNRWLWNPAFAGAAAAVMLVLVVAAAVTWSGLEKEEAASATQVLQPLRAPAAAPAATVDELRAATPADAKDVKTVRESLQHEGIRDGEPSPDQPAGEPVIGAGDFEIPRALEEADGRGRPRAMRPAPPKRKMSLAAKPAPTAPAPRAARNTPWEEKRPAEPTLDSPAAGPAAPVADVKPADDRFAGSRAGEAEPKFEAEPKKDDRRFAQPPPPPTETAVPATRSRPEKAEAKKGVTEKAARRDATGADEADEDVASVVAGGAEAQAATATGASSLGRIYREQPERRAKEAEAPAGGGGLAGGKRLAADMSDDKSTPKSAGDGAERGPGLVRRAEREAAGGDYRQAAALVREALSSGLSPGQIKDARFALARWLFLSGDCQAALPAIDQALAGAPGHPAAGAALLDRASCHERTGRLSQAIEGYRRVVRDHPAQAAEAHSALRRLHAE